MRILSTVLFLMASVNVFGQTNFYEQVSSMWYAGNKKGVLSIAELRLQQNTNDVAGLILKMNYELEYLDFQQMTNSMLRVLDVGARLKTPHFAAIFPSLRQSINHLLQMIPLYPSDQIASDRRKGNIPHKPLSFGNAIKALQDDGYFNRTMGDDSP